MAPPSPAAGDTKEAKQPSKWGLFKWGQGKKKVKVAHLPEGESNMYYHAELKRWVERGKEDEAANDPANAPPPTTALAFASQRSISQNDLTRQSVGQSGSRKALSSRYVMQNNLSVSSSASDLTDAIRSASTNNLPPSSNVSPSPRGSMAGGTTPLSKSFFVPSPAPNSTDGTPAANGFKFFVPPASSDTSPDQPDAAHAKNHTSHAWAAYGSGGLRSARAKRSSSGAPGTSAASSNGTSPRTSTGNLTAVANGWPHAAMHEPLEEESNSFTAASVQQPAALPEFGSHAQHAGPDAAMAVGPADADASLFTDTGSSHLSDGPAMKLPGSWGSDIPYANGTDTLPSKQVEQSSWAALHQHNDPATIEERVNADQHASAGMGTETSADDHQQHYQQGEQQQGGASDGLAAGGLPGSGGYTYQQTFSTELELPLQQSLGAWAAAQDQQHGQHGLSPRRALSPENGDHGGAQVVVNGNLGAHAAASAAPGPDGFKAQLPVTQSTGSINSYASGMSAGTNVPSGVPAAHSEGGSSSLSAISLAVHGLSAANGGLRTAHVTATTTITATAPTATSAAAAAATGLQGAAKGLQSKGRELLGALAGYVASHVGPSDGSSSVFGDGSEDVFDSAMHPGCTGKLDGPLPWELPEHLRYSDEFLSFCTTWQRNNPGKMYRPELLLLPAVPEADTTEGFWAGTEAAQAHSQAGLDGGQAAPAGTAAGVTSLPGQAAEAVETVRIQVSTGGDATSGVMPQVAVTMAADVGAGPALWAEQSTQPQHADTDAGLHAATQFMHGHGHGHGLPKAHGHAQIVVAQQQHWGQDEGHASPNGVAVELGSEHGVAGRAAGENLLAPFPTAGDGWEADSVRVVTGDLPGATVDLVPGASLGDAGAEAHLATGSAGVEHGVASVGMQHQQQGQQGSAREFEGEAAEQQGQDKLQQTSSLSLGQDVPNIPVPSGWEVDVVEGGLYGPPPTHEAWAGLDPPAPLNVMSGTVLPSEQELDLGLHAMQDPRVPEHIPQDDRYSGHAQAGESTVESLVAVEVDAALLRIPAGDGFSGPFAEPALQAVPQALQAADRTVGAEEHAALANGAAAGGWDVVEEDGLGVEASAASVYNGSAMGQGLFAAPVAAGGDDVAFFYDGSGSLPAPQPATAHGAGGLETGGAQCVLPDGVSEQAMAHHGAWPEAHGASEHLMHEVDQLVSDLVSSLEPSGAHATDGWAQADGRDFAHGSVAEGVRAALDTAAAAAAALSLAGEGGDGARADHGDAATLLLQLLGSVQAAQPHAAAELASAAALLHAALRNGTLPNGVVQNGIDGSPAKDAIDAAVLLTPQRVPAVPPYHVDSSPSPGACQGSVAHAKAGQASPAAVAAALADGAGAHTPAYHPTRPANSADAEADMAGEDGYKAALEMMRAELQADFDARLAIRTAELESHFEARLAAAREEIQQQYEQKLAERDAEIAAQRQRCDELQEDLDQLLLCLGQESRKVTDLSDAMRAAGLDPDAIILPIEEEYAMMDGMPGEDEGEAEDVC